MFSKLVCLLLPFIFTASVHAQADDSARLRVIQLSFVPDVSSAVDVLVNDAVVFADVSFPFATDYIALVPGNHMLTTALAGQEAFAATVTLDLAASHSYSIIVEGDYTDAPSFTVIDETALSSADAGNAAVVVNLTTEPIRDIYLDDEVEVDQIEPGRHHAIRLPESAFTLSGSLGDDSYSEAFEPLSNTLLVFVVRSTPTGDAQIIPYRSSPLTVAEYLLTASDGAPFAGLNAADVHGLMPEGGSYTAFLPADELLPENTHIAAHIVAASLPPYLLPDHDTLEALDGSTHTLQFADTRSGYWEIEGAPILWDMRLADGVIYAIDGIIVQ